MVGHRTRESLSEERSFYFVQLMVVNCLRFVSIMYVDVVYSTAKVSYPFQTVVSDKDNEGVLRVFPQKRIFL